MKPLADDDPREIGGFRLLGLLGEGGMGRVFVGRSRSGRGAAVKILRGVLSADGESAERFRREIGAARAVSGAFTAPVLDAGPDDHPPWLATSLSGPSLGEAIRELGPLPPPAVWRLAIGLAEALANVHANAYIHRDLKPGNVLLDTDGVKLIDFGVSRSPDSSITVAGALIGTFDFMSPEQRLGRRAESASDVFSLGCVVVFTATGSLPAAPTLSGLDRVPEGLRDLVRACLAIDPETRPTASRLMSEAAELFAASPAAPAVNYWPEPVASFVGSWQLSLLADAGTAGSAPMPTGESTIAMVRRTLPWPSSRASTLPGSLPGSKTPLPGSFPESFRGSEALPDGPTYPDGLTFPDDPPHSGGPAFPDDPAMRLRADSPPAPRGEPRHPEAAARAAQADLLRLRQRHADAADAYQASIDLDPADPEVHNDLGLTFWDLDRLTDAERCFRRAIDLASDYLAAHHNLCVTLCAAERFADAVASAEAAIGIADGDPAGHENRGDALYRLARRDEAAEAYRRAAALDPGNPRLDGKLKRAQQEIPR